MPDPLDHIALVYDDDAFRETTQRPANAAQGAPAGLMGRQVAGKEFLDALLDHGRWSRLVGLVGNPRSGQSLQELWTSHWANRPKPQPEKRLRVLDWRNAWDGMLQPEPLARVVHLPGPPQGQFAWARSASASPAGFAITGLTHTLCTADVMRLLTDLVTAPFEPFDTIICTSRAAADVVRRVTGTYAEHLAERLGASTVAPLRPRVATIPLGVDPALYRPPTPDERAARRRAMGIADDEVVVMYVGRLSFHAKAHPFPMYAGVAEAARRTGRKVRLVLSGWANDPDARTAFVNGAAAFAPNVRTSFVDSLAPEARYTVWHAADVFTSLSDNLQETFGLSIIQAMSCGLPVVASDWNGYRDLVAEGETGYLVPTTTVRDATADAAVKLLLGQTRYDEFAGECSQSAAVDVAVAGAAYERLIADDALRQRLGRAGRARVESRFTWAGVVRAYEDLWSEQEAERVRHAAAIADGGRNPQRPACFPPPDHAFAAYPTRTLNADARVITVHDAPPDRLDRLLGMALTGYLYPLRCTDPKVLTALLRAAAAGCTVAALDELLADAGFDRVRGRATIGWLLKYDLIRSAG